MSPVIAHEFEPLAGRGGKLPSPGSSLPAGGGDLDGNPLVTPEIRRTTAQWHTCAAIDLYERQCAVNGIAFGMKSTG